MGDTTSNACLARRVWISARTTRASYSAISDVTTPLNSQSLTIWDRWMHGPHVQVVWDGLQCPLLREGLAGHGWSLVGQETNHCHMAGCQHVTWGHLWPLHGFARGILSAECSLNEGLCLYCDSDHEEEKSSDVDICLVLHLLKILQAVTQNSNYSFHSLQPAGGLECNNSTNKLYLVVLRLDERAFFYSGLRHQEFCFDSSVCLDRQGTCLSAKWAHSRLKSLTALVRIFRSSSSRGVTGGEPTTSIRDFDQAPGSEAVVDITSSSHKIIIIIKQIRPAPMLSAFSEKGTFLIASACNVEWTISKGC